MSKTKKEYKNKAPTLKQSTAIKHMLEKGGSVASAMRSAGYSPATIKNPDHLTKSKAFIKILEKAGVTDNLLAKKHVALLNSSRLDRETFDAVRKGRKWVHFTDEQIKTSIEGTEENPTGCRIMYIKTFPEQRIALFRTPDNPAQAKALEMGYKVKDHFAPDKFELVEHELTPEEQEIVEAVFK